MIGSRRRGRRWPVVVLGVLWAATTAVWGWAFLFERAAPVGIERAAAAAGPRLGSPEAVSAGARPDARLLPVFARGGSVELHGVSPDVVAVAFHEAAYADAVELRPVGRCLVCRNRSKFTPTREGQGGPRYIVMDTRGRRSGATSAVDAVLPAGAEVLAPVTGTVTGLRRYRLYGRHWDIRVEVRPAVARDRRLVMLHLEGVTLVPGDQLEASVTRVGTVRRFPFESQVDRYVGGGLPHVHMEVKRPATGGARQRSKG